MELGLLLPHLGPNAVPDHIIKIGKLAEELGFNSLWCNDHLIMPSDSDLSGTYGRLFEGFITLAALSTVTENIKLGTGVMILPLRDPVLVAKQAATLDAFANGRLILGVGVGWEEEEYRFLNVDFYQRGRRCDEWLDVIRSVWQGTGIDVSSEVYHITEGVSEPVPVQPDGPPILIGGNSGAAFRRAARLGDGWIAGSYVSVDQIVEGAQRIKDQAPVDHSGLLYAFRRPSGSLAETAVADQMIVSLQALKNAGVQEAILALPVEYSSEVVIAEITMFAEQIMSHFL